MRTKPVFRTTLLLALLLAVPVAAGAELQWTVNDEGTVTITQGSCVEGELVIPEAIEGREVTSIGMYAFSGCSGLTSVTIPNSVTEIGRGAFDGAGSVRQSWRRGLPRLPDSPTPKTREQRRNRKDKR